MRSRLVLFAIMLAAARPSNGQTVAPLRVNVLRQLEFGALIDGFETAVRPSDMRATAMFEIIGPARATVQLVFTLPESLIGENAGRVNVTFGSQSAAYSVSESNVDLIAFDPRAPFSLTLPANGRVVVLIGGAAKSARQLASGRYTSSLSLSVTRQ